MAAGAPNSVIIKVQSSTLWSGRENKLHNTIFQKHFQIHHLHHQATNVSCGEEEEGVNVPLDFPSEASHVQSGGVWFDKSNKSWKMASGPGSPFGLEPPGSVV